MGLVFPGSEFVGDASRLDEEQETGADQRLMFKTPNGKEFYVYLTRKEVWIDVSRLEEGDGGAAVYAVVGNYAWNARKMFIGDPAGLSESAIIRRTSHMLSLALRYGSSNFMEPAQEQLDGDVEKGIAPLRWPVDDTERVKALAKCFLLTMHQLLPTLKNAYYDFDSGHFYGDSAQLLDRGRAQLAEESTRSGARGARAGEATLRRAIFLQSLVSTEGEKQPRLLEDLQLWHRAYVERGGLNGLF